MIDLLPPLTFLVCASVQGFALIAVRRNAKTFVAPRARVLFAFTALILTAVPYVVFFALQGDLDVWDFYRSVWFVPLIVLAVTVCAAFVSARRATTVVDARVVESGFRSTTQR